MYLFGSFSNGKQTQDSDIDLALLFDRAIDQEFEDIVTRVIYAFDLKYDTIIDNHIFNYLEFQTNTYPIVLEIKQHGKFYG